MTYLEYLWQLCFRPFKLTQTLASNSIYLFWSAIAAVAERVRTDIYFARAQFHLQRASYWSLLRHGQDIGLHKIDSEDYETYRQRLINAYEVFREGGTIPGMLRAMELLGLTSVEVVEHYKTIGQEEWAVFSIVTPLEEMPAGLDYQDVDRMIWKLKPAHTLGLFRRECFRTDNPASLTDRDWLCQ